MGRRTLTAPTESTGTLYDKLDHSFGTDDLDFVAAIPGALTFNIDIRTGAVVGESYGVRAPHCGKM